MTIIFKKTNSPNNTVIKSFTGNSQTFECYLINETSVINPTLDVVTDFATAAQYNYCEIPDLGRKYFINDIISLDGERVRIQANVDVLSSFSNAVLSAQVLTNRSTKNVNVFVPDNYLQNSTRGISQIKTFSGGEWLPNVLADTNGIVVNTFGGDFYGN